MELPCAIHKACLCSFGLGTVVVVLVAAVAVVTIVIVELIVVVIVVVAYMVVPGSNASMIHTAFSVAHPSADGTHTFILHAIV